MVKSCMPKVAMQKHFPLSSGWRDCTIRISGAAELVRTADGIIGVAPDCLKEFISNGRNRLLYMIIPEGSG